MSSRGMLARWTVASSPLHRRTREPPPSAPTIHLACTRPLCSCTPSDEIPDTGVFHKNRTPQCSALATSNSCGVPPNSNSLPRREICRGQLTSPAQTEFRETHSLRFPSGEIPKSRNAACVSGINPSPHGLSIGGSAPSATVTCNPSCCAAIAAANPAGPPPTTKTSVLSLMPTCTVLCLYSISLQSL